MKAALCTHYGPPEELVVRSVQEPQPGAGELLIHMKACGVSFPDALMIQGKYQRIPPFPFAPGGEVAGVVCAVGPGVDAFAPGDRVAAWTGFGGFADLVLARQSRTVKLPENVSFETAAASILVYATALHALRDRAVVKAYERVLVLGAAGGVGLAAVQVAKLLGAHTVAACSNNQKLQTALGQGADVGFIYPESLETQEDQSAFRENVAVIARGPHVIFDPVGGGYFTPGLKEMQIGGRYLIVGFSTGSIPKMPANIALLKMASVLGVSLYAFSETRPEKFSENLRTLFHWISEGLLKPHVHETLCLQDAPKAVRSLMDRTAIGKLVLVN